MLTRRFLGALLCVATLSACGGRSSLLDVDDWLAEQDDTEGRSGAGGHVEAPLDPGHDEMCGKGLKGPRMVLIPLPQGGSFCIDSTEITRRQYRAFFQAGVSLEHQPAVCAWNDDYEAPLVNPHPDNNPVIMIDWCDARAYCAWAGKRLCGKIGGGHIAVENPQISVPVDPLKEEWAYAATAGGTRIYPYGNVYEDTACVTTSYDGYPNNSVSVTDIRPVGEAKKCEGGFPGLYDMGGNVSEWIDESDKETGITDIAIALGPSYASLPHEANYTFYVGDTRDGGWGDIGIRCCKDGPF